MSPRCFTPTKLIALRKQAVLTWGDYQDLLPNSPVLWCYRREWKGQTLLVIANLSRETPTLAARENARQLAACDA